MMRTRKRFGCFLNQRVRFRRVLFLLPSLGLLVAFSSSWAQVAPGSMDVHWNEGAPDCASNPQPPIQVHRYNPRTYVLRESLCVTFEAPFMYLLIGSTRAMLIDTGDVADPNRMPLAKTVLDLLPSDGSQKLPLLVVHTHRHLDHRAGDGQFSRLAHVEVVGFDIDSVKRFYKFNNWPNGLAQIKLGNRIVDVIPTPGHNETEVSFYDRETGLFFSGDFLLPGRLLVDNTSEYIASAERAAAFVKDRPVAFVLGGHIEKNIAGEAFPWESQYHPQEHVLQLQKDDLLGLPAVIRSFNGFYLVRGQFILMNSIRILILLGAVAGVGLVGFAWALIHLIRRRRRAKRRLSENKARKTA